MSLMHFKQGEDIRDYCVRYSPLIIEICRDGGCSNCIRMHPLMEHAVKTYGINVLKVDCDKFPRESNLFNVRLLPGVVLFINGQQKDQFEGYDVNGYNRMVPKAIDAIKNKTQPMPQPKPQPQNQGGNYECHGDSCRYVPKGNKKPLRPEPEFGTEGSKRIDFTTDGKNYFARNFYTDDNIGLVRQWCCEKLNCSNCKLFYETNPKTYFNKDNVDLIFVIDDRYVMWVTPC